MRKCDVPSGGYAVAFVCLVLLLLLPSGALAQGGCGSVCIPLESLDPEQTQLNNGQLRLSVIFESGTFDNFREGGSAVTNPGGNKANIDSATAFLEYGISERFTISTLLPYTRKRQQTNRFGLRTAEGIGDVAIFGRYEVVSPENRKGPSISIGLGLKFPTGGIEEPGGGVARLPPPFQNGSGAYDLIPTLTYFQSFQRFSLFGSSLWRAPLESNKFDYEFGDEFEVHFGILYPLAVWKGRLELSLSADFLEGGHDTDGARFLPAQLRNGSTVLNTGGTFLDLTPGIRLRITPDLTTQARFFIPVVEEWNGERSRNVGQVAPDLTIQFGFSYNIR